MDDKINWNKSCYIFFVKFLIFIPLLHFLTLNSQSFSIHALRKAYKICADNEEVTEKWLNFFEKHDVDNDVLWLAYKGGFYIAKSKHASVFSKLSWFNKGKKILEKAIAKNPNLAELRFIRYSIQYNVPKILGYNHNLEEDKKFILNHIHQIDDEEYQKDILNYVKGKPKKINP